MRRMRPNLLLPLLLLLCCGCMIVAESTYERWSAGAKPGLKPGVYCSMEMCLLVRDAGEDLLALMPDEDEGCVSGVLRGKDVGNGRTLLQYTMDGESMYVAVVLQEEGFDVVDSVDSAQKYMEAVDDAESEKDFIAAVDALAAFVRDAELEPDPISFRLTDKSMALVRLDGDEQPLLQFYEGETELHGGVPRAHGKGAAMSLDMGRSHEGRFEHGVIAE